MTDFKDAAYREQIWRHLFFKTPGEGSVMVPVRMKPDMLKAIDNWIEAFDEASEIQWGMTRAAAVRWIIVEHLMLDPKPTKPTEHLP